MKITPKVTRIKNHLLNKEEAVANNNSREAEDKARNSHHSSNNREVEVVDPSKILNLMMIINKRSQQNQRRQGDDEDESEHEKEKEELYEQDHDRRHLGPFNVDRAPTGQFVPKGSIRDPINKYKDSKEKGGPGKTGDRGSHSQKQGGGQRSGQSRDNEFLMIILIMRRNNLMKMKIHNRDNQLEDKVRRDHIMIWKREDKVRDNKTEIEELPKILMRTIKIMKMTMTKRIQNHINKTIGID